MKKLLLKKLTLGVLVLSICFSAIGVASTSAKAATPTLGQEKYTTVKMTNKKLKAELKKLKKVSNEEIKMSWGDLVMSGIGFAPIAGAYFSIAGVTMTAFCVCDSKSCKSEANYLQKILYNMGSKKYAQFKVRYVWSYVKPPQIYGWKYYSMSFVKYTN